jgi:two-component sensor histidine kinase
VRPPLFSFRRPSRRVTIRFRLGLAVAIALSPILALGVVQGGLSFTHDSQTRQESLVAAAQRSASATRAKMQAAAAVLETLTPQTVGLECAPRLASLLDRLRGYENFIRFNSQGRVQCAAASVGADPNIQNSQWFSRLKSGEPLVVVTAPEHLYSERPSVLAAMRAGGDDGGFDGALVALLSVDSLRPDVSDPTLPPDTEVALIDDQGRIAAATNIRAFAPPPAGWAAKAMAPGGLLYRAKALDGQPRSQVVAPLVGDDLFVMLSAPAPRFLSWARLNAIYNIVLPLIGWLAAWMAVWIVTDRVVIRWLHYLDRIASIYAKGRFSVRPVQAENAPQEIRALAQTLDTMADAIVVRDLTLHENLEQKDTLMREIHHRVKNNLQIITSLLNMQQRALKDPAAREAMADTRQRITALALIYRALYQSPDLRRVDLRQFLEELIGQMASGDGGRPSIVRTELKADDLEIDPDKLAPLALFAVEAIANARRRAFVEGEGLIKVSFTVLEEEVALEISDNGVEDAACEAAEGVGRTLMSAFARQLRGRMEISTLAEGGAVVRLTFPPPEPPKDFPPSPFQLSSTRNPVQS